MPDIKYTGVPTVTPEEARRTAEIPGYNLRYPEVTLSRGRGEALAAIGHGQQVLGNTMTTVGAAIHTLGRTLDTAGNELYSRAEGLQRLQQESNADGATISWSLDQVKRDEEFRRKKELAANSDALAAHLKSSEDARQAARAKLGSDLERKLFDQETRRTFIVSARAAGSHAANETRQHNINSQGALLDITKGQMVNAKEDADYEYYRNEGAKIFDKLTHIHGWDENERNVAYNKWRTEALLGRIQKIGDTDHRTALEMLGKHEAEITAVDPVGFLNVRKALTKEGEDSDALTAANRAVSPDADKDPAAARSQMIDELRRAGYTDDERGLKVIARANQYLDARLARQAHDRAVEHTNVRNRVTGAAYGHVPGQERAPTTVEELWAGVKDEDKSKLTEEERHHFEDIALKNAMEIKETPATLAEFRLWQGLMIRDPKQVLDRQAQEPGFIDKFNMPLHRRDALTSALLHLQAQGEKAAADLRVGQAWKYGVDHNLIIDKFQRKNDKDGHALHSYIAESLDAWHARHPKQIPKGDDYRDIINGGLQQREAETGLRAWIGGERPEFKRLQNWSDPKFKKYRADYLADHKGAGEAEIRGSWLRDNVRKRLDEEEGRKIKPKSTTMVPIGG